MKEDKKHMGRKEEREMDGRRESGVLSRRIERTRAEGWRGRG